MLEALRIRDFRWLWFARLVSLLGSWLLVVAVPAHVFALTGSVAATGLTMAAEYLPPVLLGSLAGVLADRWDRRSVMIVADVVRAAAITLLLLVREPGDLWLIYVALLVESVGTVMFRPAAQAHTPAVVGTGTSLSSANALNAVTDGAVRLIGAPLGGALFAWAGFGVLVWLDTGTYLLSAAAVLLTTATPAAARPDGRSHILKEQREGLTFLRSQPTARSLLLISSLFLGANACLAAILVPYGITVLGGSRQTGLVMSALGVGFLIGAPLMRTLVDRTAPAYLLGAALAVTGGGYVALFTATTLPVALLAAGLIGTSGSMALGTAQTTLQRVTPGRVLGRISAAMLTGEAVATLAGALAGPAVAAALSLRWTASLSGTATIFSAALAVVLLPRTTTPAPALDRRTAEHGSSIG